jgi:hypothetical protein
MKYPQGFLDAHRYINVDDRHWYEHIEERFIRKMKRIGVVVEDVRFELAYCQGDGASFTGYVENIARFLTFMTGTTQSYPVWRLAAKKGLLRINIERSAWARGSHPHSVDVVVEADRFGGWRSLSDEDDGDALFAVETVWDQTIDNEFHTFQDDCKAYLRAFMHLLYKELDKEHEYQTTDEAVAATLEANEIYVDEDTYA